MDSKRVSEMGLQAYHGKAETKQFFIDRMQAHIDADELVTGVGWESNGTIKGCSVGCLFHEYNHALGPELMGTPEWLHRLQDVIHEESSDEFRAKFSLEFLTAIPIGADVEPVRSQIQLFIQRSNKERVQALDIDAGVKQQVIDAIDLCIVLHSGEWDDEAAESAESAASAAWSASRSVDSAASAAWSAASAARSASRSVESAASAAWSAAWSAARSAEADAIGAELIRLLKAA